MPLSEYEQRVLEQMERALTSDDPRLANTLQSPKRHPVFHYALAGAAVVVGLLLLVVGAATSRIWLGAIGFVLMFGGVVYAFQSPRSRRGPVGTVDAEGKTRPKQRKGSSARKGSSPARPGFMARLEQRWDRRREQGGR